MDAPPPSKSKSKSHRAKRKRRPTKRARPLPHRADALGEAAQRPGYKWQSHTWGSAVYVAPDASDKAQREQAQFAPTIYGTAPASRYAEAQDHVDRPPTLVWDLQETEALSRLDRDPNWARFPPITSSSKPRGKGALHPREGARYVPPQLSTVLETQRGFGCSHAAPPVGDQRHALSHSQRIVYGAQNRAYQMFPHRAQRVIRKLRRAKNPAPLQGVSPALAGLPAKQFCLGNFLKALEKETQQRLVHLAIRETGREGSRRLDVDLGFSLDSRGRIFSCIRWQGLLPPALACINQDNRQGQPPQPLLWWGNAVVPADTKPTLFIYTCPCTVS